jgi:hypothetical protein
MVILLIFIAACLVPLTGGDSLCSPLHNTPEKIAMTHALIKGVAMSPVVFWHLQKSGGTSFCELAKQEWVSKGKKLRKIHSTNTCKAPIGAVFGQSNGPGQWKRAIETGWHFIFLEPADHYKTNWPSDFHASPVFNRMLTKGLQDKAPEWQGLLHVLILRNPLERALSAFNYRYFGWSNSIREACSKKGLDTDECMTMAFKLKNETTASYNKDNGEPTWALGIWTKHQIVKILTQVLGNFLLNHLAVGEDMGVAKANMRSFAVILDLSMPAQNGLLLNCVLGWKHINHTSSTNANAQSQPSIQLLDLLSHNTRSRILGYIDKDMTLYDYGLRLLLDHHKRALQELHV